ncbi:sensor histidine kinase [Janibacter sp. GXQ6167]|uniref:sensor histidine kinase n=1 Tax=Janibacter sp. GXQ6167 TaxID=3240791 RepID=UPI0035250CB0
MTDPGGGAAPPSPDASEGGASAAALDRMWEEQQVRWHLAFGAITAITGVIGLIDIDDARGRLILLTALSILVGSYVVFGRRGLLGDGRAAWIHLATGIAALLVILGVTGSGAGWLLAFILIPQAWAALPIPGALAAVVVMMCGGGLAQWRAHGYDREMVNQLGVTVVLSLAAAIFLGLFINRLVEEANQRALTIDELRRTRAELAAAERSQGIYAERERLAREIHDTLAQGFTSVIALARATESALAKGDQEAAVERLEMIEQAASDNLSEARLLVAELTPGHLTSRTLPEALDRLAGALRRESGLDARFVLIGEPQPLGSTVEVVILRAVQEALSNVRRHAAAKGVEVRLDLTDREVVRVRIADDGRGYDTEARRDGYGLDGIAERARRLDGAVQITSNPGEGTTLTMEVPR